MKNNVHLGRVIRQLMERSDGSVNAAAERLDYTVQALYAIFDKEDVNTSLLKKLSIAYDVPLTYFFNSYLWVDAKSALTEDGAVKNITNRIENDTRLTIMESENNSLKEQNKLLREMIEMYKKQGQIAGQND